MYANLRGAKIFTTLDLCSGYYHIALDQDSKAKTAFVTPFGNMSSMQFLRPSTSTCIFSATNIYRIAGLQ